MPARRLLLLIAALITWAPFSHASITGANSLSAGGSIYSSRQSSGAAAPTALETLMASAVGRWKASDAACNGTKGDCSDGEDVETLHDSSSGGNNFTQNTASAKPTWDADCGGSESFGCLSFDGTSDEMSAGDILDGAGEPFAGNDHTIVFVAVRGNVTTSDVFFSKVNGTTNAQFAFSFDGTAGVCDSADVVFRHYPAGTTARRYDFCSESDNIVDLHSYIIKYDASEPSSNRVPYIGQDGYEVDSIIDSTVGTDGAIVDKNGDLIIGDYQSPDGFNAYMRFAEAIVFPRLLTSDEITTINTYLKDTYGIVRPPPGYVADWRADQAACSGTQGDCANGETAETLHDLGSGGNDFTNATGTDVPTYVAAGPNSQPAINFDGTDDNYNAGDVDLFSGTDSDWAVVGVYINEADQEGVLLGKYSSSQTEILIDVDNASCADGTIVYLHYSLANGTSYRWTCGDTSIRDGSYHSFVWNYDGSQDASDGLARFDVYEDGVALTETVDGTAGALGDIQNTTGDLTIGYLSGGSTFLDGKMAELLVYPAPLTAAQITGLSEYLTARYGL